MKKIFLFFAFVFCINSAIYTQIKVTNSGAVGIGSLNTPAYRLDVYSGYSRLYYTSTRYLEINNWNYEPRIEAEHGVVFYNTSQGDYINLKCKILTEYSDSSAKEDIEYLRGKSLEKVLKLKGVSYYWKKDKLKEDKKRDIGFLAQEVEQVLPELVYRNDTSDQLMLSYTHVVPLLVEAIKELNEKIIGLEQKANNKNGQVINVDEYENEAIAVLYQNKPNPFSDKTSIAFYIPEHTLTARLFVFSLSGEIIKQYEISDRGKGSTQLNAYELNPGMYLYSLVIDNKEIDTKRMILTD